MNYPSGIKKKCMILKSHANRGMGLEFELNETNKFYLNENIANVHKKPTPITISRVDFKSRVDAVIKEAYFKTPSTTDYNGVYKGKYIDFEAKETSNLSYFPLANIHKHQIEHIKSVISHGGIGFIIVRFTKLDETYYLDGSNLVEFVESKIRKSIPLSYFREKGFILKTNINPYIDYLKVIDSIYFKGGNV
ncbi:MAG TPA: Holliday junction resolvase RecU [Tenericutes bacterium]|nr:Holliday junction resolvase RecU [Mycoplasmatota bacterium]